MERVAHARIPVHLNAVLIGEKTVPKGCKVRNVSDQGMLLTCEADGRILTFRDGDSVDIHLLFQRPDGTKYLSISAIVRHVDANGIGVKFTHPDAQLVNLIENYRIDKPRDTGASMANQEMAPEPARPESEVMSPAPVFSGHADREQLPVDTGSHRYYYLGLLTLVMAIGIITAGYLGTSGLGKGVNGLEAPGSGYERELPRSEIQPQPGSDGGTGDISNDSEIPLISAESESESAPEQEGAVDAPTQVGVSGPIHSGVAAGVPVTEEMDAAPAAGLSHEEENVDPLSTASATPDGRETGSAKTNDHVVVERGPWVINLLSSPSKSEADRFTERARKQGIPAEQSSVMLKGRMRYRVQLTGFQTARQASDDAGPVKEALGLKNVWIFRP
jgi:hypothetical protein